MDIQKLLGECKQRPFATALFALYMAFWITVYSLLFFFRSSSWDGNAVCSYLRNPLFMDYIIDLDIQ